MMDLNSLSFAKFQSATTKIKHTAKLFQIASEQNTFYCNPEFLKYRPQTKIFVVAKKGMGIVFGVHYIL